MNDTQKDAPTTFEALLKERDAARDGLAGIGPGHERVARLRNAEAALLAHVAALTKERDAYKLRGDNHWETLRSIRHIARTEGDLARIIQWVNDAGIGYTETAEATMAALQDCVAKAESALAEKDKALHVAISAMLRVKQIVLHNHLGWTPEHEHVAPLCDALVTCRDAFAAAPKVPT